MTKTPIPTEISKKQWTTQKRHQNFHYTTIADRLGTVSWSNNSNQTGVVKPVYGYPTFPLTTKAVHSKGHTFKKNVNNLPYRD